MDFSGKFNQTLVYWPHDTQYNLDGEQSFSASTTFKGRFEETNEVFTDAFGKEHISNAVVYAERDFTLSGYILNSSSSTSSNPANLAGAYEIKKIMKTPSLNANQFLRKVFL